MFWKTVGVATLAVLGTVWRQPAAAQASSPVAQEPRRAEMLVASKDGPPSPAGQGGAPAARPAATAASKTVAERKAQTLEAARRGQLVPAGHGSPTPSP